MHLHFEVSHLEYENAAFKKYIFIKGPCTLCLFPCYYPSLTHTKFIVPTDNETKLYLFPALRIYSPAEIFIKPFYLNFNCQRILFYILAVV